MLLEVFCVRLVGEPRLADIWSKLLHNVATDTDPGKLAVHGSGHKRWESYACQGGHPMRMQLPLTQVITQSLVLHTAHLDMLRVHASHVLHALAVVFGFHPGVVLATPHGPQGSRSCHWSSGRTSSVPL